MSGLLHPTFDVGVRQLQRRRQFGSYDVSILEDGLFKASSDILTHNDGPAARDRALEALGAPSIEIVVNCFLLRGPTGNTMIDAGTGTAWGADFGFARAALASEGVRIRDVDHILLTHLHGDHALGLFDGGGAHYPEAEIFVPEAEFDFFTDSAARESVPSHRRGGFAIAEQLNQWYPDRIRLVGPGPVLPGIEAIPLPGHTPGQVGYLVGDARGFLMLWGDAMHLPALQAADPEIGVIYDGDSGQAAHSRRTVLNRSVQDGWTVSGGHVDGFMTVVAEDGAYRMISA